MKSLTIGMATSRHDPKLTWVMDSLYAMGALEHVDRIILVDSFATGIRKTVIDGFNITIAQPKSTIWAGPHRLTSEDWWSASSARNSIIALCETQWLGLLDDRCVLSPTWLQSIKGAMDGNYAVFGTYEKRVEMEVVNGVITNPGETIGIDNRLAIYEKMRGADIAMPSFPSWAYGCSLALPLEWALQVGGFEEACDGHGAEDTAFGAMLANNGYPMRFDPRMGVIQDRTPSQSGPTMKREDKGVSPNDLSHKMIELFHCQKQTTNKARLLESRAAVLAGKPFPVNLQEAVDWYDGEIIGPDYMRIDKIPHSP